MGTQTCAQSSLYASQGVERRKERWCSGRRDPHCTPVGKLTVINWVPGWETSAAEPRGSSPASHPAWPPRGCGPCSWEKCGRTHAGRARCPSRCAVCSCTHIMRRTATTTTWPCCSWTTLWCTRPPCAPSACLHAPTSLSRASTAGSQAGEPSERVVSWGRSWGLGSRVQAWERAVRVPPPGPPASGSMEVDFKREKSVTGTVGPPTTLSALLCLRRH